MNINHFTKIFIKNIMLGAGDVYLSLIDVDRVYLAVQKAYMAMQPRNFGKKVSTAKISVQAKKAVLWDLSQKFVDYFKSPAPQTQANFDDWHTDLCNWFLTTFNQKVLLPGGYNPTGYGKAQKIVNVTFKYLYLFAQLTEGYPTHFTFCHFTIDFLG